MQVMLLETEGRGGAADVEVDGRRLRVVDAVSSADRPVRPGVIERAKLEVVMIPNLTRREPGGAAGASGIEAEHGWRHRATGVIVSIRPLRADFGTLQLDLQGGGGEGWAVGDRVCVAIDRIILTRERGVRPSPADRLPDR